jgi:hypothetical protein
VEDSRRCLTCPQFLCQALCWSESRSRGERRSRVEHRRALGYSAIRHRARGFLTSGRRRGSLTPERWTRVIVCCLAPEDGQGSGSAGQCETSRPLYGIRRKASKGLIRRSRVLQNPHSWVQVPPSPPE